jgi:hypothetical protein
MLFPILSSLECRLLLRPTLLLMVVLPFLRCRGSSTVRLLMPFLHSGLLHSLLSNVPPLGLLGATSSLRLYPAQRVTFFPAAVTFFRGPQFA